MRLELETGRNRMEFKIADRERWFGYFYRDSMIYTDFEGNYVSEEGYYTDLGGYYHWEGNIEFVIE